MRYGQVRRTKRAIDASGTFQGNETRLPGYRFYPDLTVECSEWYSDIPREMYVMDSPQQKVRVRKVKILTIDFTLNDTGYWCLWFQREDSNKCKISRLQPLAIQYLHRKRNGSGSVGFDIQCFTLPNEINTLRVSLWRSEMIWLPSPHRGEGTQTKHPAHSMRPGVVEHVWIHFRSQVIQSPPLACHTIVSETPNKKRLGRTQHSVGLIDHHYTTRN